MSAAYQTSHAAEAVCRAVEQLDQERHREREAFLETMEALKQERRDVRRLETELAAAEKRAEEAEALLATARDDLDPLRTDLEEYEGQPAREVAASLMADPEECGPRVCKVSVLAALELLEKLESAPTQPQEPKP